MIDRIKEKIKAAGQKAESAGKWLTVIEPVSPYNKKGMLTALITAAGLISVTLLAGVGLATLLVLLVCLGMILLILAKVFGVEFDMNPEEMFRNYR